MMAREIVQIGFDTADFQEDGAAKINAEAERRGLVPCCEALVKPHGVTLEACTWKGLVRRIVYHDAPNDCDSIRYDALFRLPKVPA
jgi:hypothetical protein